MAKNLLNIAVDLLSIFGVVIFLFLNNAVSLCLCETEPIATSILKIAAYGFCLFIPIVTKSTQIHRVIIVNAIVAFSAYFLSNILIAFPPNLILDYSLYVSVVVVVIASVFHVFNIWIGYSIFRKNIKKI